MPDRNSAYVTENMNNLPLEELEKYENKWVAWTMDGTRIIAGADDISDLEPAVKAAGLTMSEVVFEFIPPLDMAYLGAGGDPVPYAVAPVRLSIADATQGCEWTAMVGFRLDRVKALPVLGHAGCLQFFTAEFHGDSHEVILTPNRTFSGNRS